MADELDGLEEILEETEVYAAIVFGSYARGEEYSDIDVALFTDGDVEEVVREAPGVFDLQRFQDLPLYIRHRVLDEGDLFYCRDRERFYDVVIRTIKAYEDFRPLHEEYLEGVRRRG
ncbi:MAG: nucleotidyltransferase domain-containing protein [Candidatus Nanohaloarchaea archaeon]|nr:nucleotidyltransferase domain-containing protein [Candidatus Nanohaloarchaea archaeon]